MDNPQQRSIAQIAKEIILTEIKIKKLLKEKGLPLKINADTLSAINDHELVMKLRLLLKERKDYYLEYTSDKEIRSPQRKLRKRKTFNNNNNYTDIDWEIGKTKFFDSDKGFGFIKCWSDNKDYYANSRNCDKGLYEDDIVVFKLAPSRSKPGSQEAVLVSELASFNSDYKFLIEQYFKYSNDEFRNTIIKILPDQEIGKIAEKELAEFSSVKNDEEYSRLKQLINKYIDTIIHERLLGLLNSNNSPFNQVANPSIYLQAWLDGIVNVHPNYNLLEEYFQRSGRDDQISLLAKVDDQTKNKLFQSVLLKKDPIVTLDFIVAYIKVINSISPYQSIKDKLFDKTYQEDKKGFELFTGAMKHFKETLDEKQEFDLFINGYMVSFSSEYVLSNISILSNAEIEKVINTKALCDSDTFNLINTCLQISIDSFLEIEKSSSTDNKEIKRSDSYYNSIEQIAWALKQARSYISDANFKLLENKILDKLPEKVFVSLWEDNYIVTPPVSSLAKILLSNENLSNKVNLWVRQNNLGRNEVIDILKSNIQKFKRITTSQQFYNHNDHLVTLLDFRIDAELLEDIITPENKWFSKLINWVDGSSEEFDFDEFKTKMVFLNSKHQIIFLKKLFWLAQSGKFELTVEKLLELTRIDFDIYSINEKINHEVPLDISVDIVIEFIKSYVEKGKPLLENDLLNIVLRNLNFNKKYRFKIADLFEKCTGRLEAKYDWNTAGTLRKLPFGDNKYYYVLDFEYNADLVEKVKKIPGRRWYTNKKNWGIPATSKEAVYEFARNNNFFIDEEGSNYKNNSHLATFSRKDIPNGIKYCEGVKAKNKDYQFDKEFWWCASQPCFGRCESIHEQEEWKQYTLLDFLLILGIEYNDQSNDIYYEFISLINRFNRLLEKLYCNECNNILYPVKKSNYAHYRVTLFSCANAECKEHNKEIYLHHCLNGKCNSIIDSRESKKCPNGLYICSDEECGSCCSHNMLERRLNSLKATGGYISTSLQKAVDDKLGHQERAEQYCYKCGKLMDEIADEFFKCNACGIKYDLGKNKFKRPNRHLGKNLGIKSKTPPIS